MGPNLAGTVCATRRGGRSRRAAQVGTGLSTAAAASCVSSCVKTGRTCTRLPAGPPALLLTSRPPFPFPGLSVPNVHGALAPLAIPSAAAAAAAAGRIAIPGLAGAGNSVLLVSNLNPEVRASSLQAVVPRSTSGGVTLVGLSAEGSGLSSCWPQVPGSRRSARCRRLSAQCSLVFLYASAHVSDSVRRRVEIRFDT